MKKKNILIIDNSLFVTGAFKSIFYATKTIKDKFNFNYILSTHSINDKVLNREGFNVSNLPFREINRNIFNNILYPFYLILNSIRLCVYIKKNNIDIVHVNDMYNLTVSIVKLFCKFSLIIHIRRMPESFPSILYRFWVFIHIKTADKIIAVSNANSKAFGNCKNIIVIYNPLPIEEKYPAIKSKVLANKNIINFVYIANYMKGKGQEHAIRALSKLKENIDKEIKIIFIGGAHGNKNNNKYKEDLKFLAGELSLTDNIIFNDFEEDTEKFIKKYDIVLNLSDSESLSRSTYEALFYGVPIIATNVGGTIEMFDDKIKNWVVPPKNIEIISEKMYEIIYNKEIVELFDNNKYKLREKFNEDKTINELIHVYNTITI